MKRVPFTFLLGIIGAGVGLGVNWLAGYAISRNHPSISDAIVMAWFCTFCVFGGIILGVSVPGEADAVASECHEDLITLRDFANELDDLDDIPECHYDCDELRKRLWGTAFRAAKRIKESQKKYHPEPQNHEEST
jgi:hypothetical protein